MRVEQPVPKNRVANLLPCVIGRRPLEGVRDHSNRARVLGGFRLHHNMLKGTHGTSKMLLVHVELGGHSDPRCVGSV